MAARGGASGLRAVIAGVLLSWGSAAHAQSTVDFDVPSAPLSQALRDIGRQGRVDILFAPETAAHRWAGPIKGRRTAEAALRSVAEHAGLEVVRTGPTSFLLRVKPEPSAMAARPGRPVPDPPEAELSEMVVTALRRPELLQRSPASITLLTHDHLSRMRGASLAEVARQAPSLSFTENGTGQRRITMRGIQSSGENTVGLYVGDTPLTGPSTATSDVSQMSPDPALVDVERIEVLRGPQGTLYGAGAMSGALRVLYRSPDLSRFSSEAGVRAESVSGGGFGHAAEAILNAPLVTGQLGARLVLYDQVTPGHVDNVTLGLSDVNEGRTTGGRLSLLYAPTPQSRLSVLALHQRQRQDDTDFGYAALGGRATDNAVRLPFPNDLSLLSLSAEMPVGALALSVNSSASRWDTERYIDSTRTSLGVIGPATYCPALMGAPACDDAQKEAYRDFVRARLPAVGRQPARVDSFTHEARLTASGGAFAWTAGLFLERRRDYSESGVYVADAATGAPSSLAERTFLRTIAIDTDQISAFGEARLELGPQWTLTAGARRYAYEKSAASQVVQSSFINGAVAGPQIRRRTHHEGLAGKLNLAFRPAPNVLVYAQVAEGFRPGGVNTVPSLPETLVVFAPDSVTSYELGLKTSFDEGRAMLNMAAFRTDWRDMQARARRPAFTYVANVGASRVEGLEVEAEASLATHLKAQVAFSLIDARLTRDQLTEEAARGRRGDRIPFEPDGVASAALTYARPIGGNRGEAYVRLGYAYVGRSASQFNRTSPYYETMGGFGLVDLRAGAAFGTWRAEGWITNLLAERGAFKVESDLNSERMTLLAQPRTVGLGLSRRF